MAIITTEDDVAIQRWFAQRAARSLASYCSDVVINSDPPRRFGTIAEPWQADIISPLIPAFERMAGLRSDYDGPRRFFITLPRGHDKTSLIARMLAWAIGFSRNQVSASCAAADKDQAQLVRNAMLKELELNRWIPVKANNYQVVGPGGRADILAADAPTASGRFDDVIIFDEITYWKNQQLFDIMLSGAHKRPSSVVVVITNAGIRGTWQWRMLEAARQDPLWNVYEAPVAKTLASWLKAADIESARAMMSKNMARRVLDNVWVDATESPLLAWEEISQCHGSPLWPGGVVPRGYVPGPLYMGIDIGRTHDLTVITTVERTKAGLAVRDMKVMHNASFDEQQREIESRLTSRVKKCYIDKGGIGMQIAERMERKYPAICTGVACNIPWQGQAAMKMLRRFRQSEIEIPNDPELNVDLQKVEEVGTSKGGVPVLNTVRDSAGHADRFWSIALALDAVPDRVAHAGAVPVASRKSRLIH